MPRAAIENNSRVALRIRPDDKARLMRACALQQVGLTEFILRHVVRAADAVIDEAQRVVLTERDSLRVLDLLENPSQPSPRLLAAAQALPPQP